MNDYKITYLTVSGVQNIIIHADTIPAALSIFELGEYGCIDLVGVEWIN